MEIGCLPLLLDGSWPADSDQLRQRVGSLYSFKKAHVYSVVLALTRNPHDAEEVTQETFLRLYVHLKSGRQVTGDPMNWLVCVARNMVVDRARRSRRENTRHSSDWWRIGPGFRDHHPSPEALAILTGQEQETIRLIGTLDGLQRQCLELRLKGISFREIGEALNVSLSVAVDQTNRAIEKMKRRVRK